jgi:hypothetical protein
MVWHILVVTFLPYNTRHVGEREVVTITNLELQASLDQIKPESSLPLRNQHHQ